MPEPPSPNGNGISAEAWDMYDLAVDGLSENELRSALKREARLRAGAQDTVNHIFDDRAHGRPAREWRVYIDDRDRTDFYLAPLGVLIEAPTVEEAVRRAANHERVVPGTYHLEPVQGSAAFQVTASGDVHIDVLNGEWAPVEEE